ncbi:dihydroorotate dehydrogenase electron transfer subunit [Jatrophihabitans sp. GAS493]|uniref:dihydroorotate dehydrogenase electron transfer subunit n=1 Tax=Jatrophihabitans sp. GAS493 TaxID=1907575 RepID=UPI000BB83913|nr:dihydroorotate dehydrogenase electron transfer subunit [Jatrophihabitans sp. GAS493]SOD73688.1 dihydroorotate dehydrogenase electron transfer subunit [Jatrophihabitans sp. GAS493]
MTQPVGVERTRPVQEKAEIFALQKVGEYLQFTVVAPGIAAGFRPGHFVAVGVGGAQTSMLLRRSFALYGATPTSDFAGTIQFVVAAHGPGTQWLVERRVGEVLDILGPLGTPFPMPPKATPAVLVGGGYGTAPLIPLAQRLIEQGSDVEIILGAATSTRLFGELVAKRAVGAVTVTTDDGSAGIRGRVTDVLDDAIARIKAEVVYACGPMPMLRAVGDVARRNAIPAQVAVEESMACGVGVCMTCVLPVRGDDGRSRMVRSCVDGPVFLADRVRWDDVGRVPHDILGADAMVGN